MTISLENRAHYMREAITMTEGMSHKQRDTAIYIYLAGCVTGHYTALGRNLEVPMWLFVIGARGGSRLQELETWLADNDA